MRIIRNNIIVYLIGCLLTLFNVACNETALSTNTASSTSGDVESSNLNEVQGTVGTVVGNPLPPKSRVYFTTVSTTPTTEGSDCPNTSNETCRITGEEFRVLVTGFSVISCKNESNETILCNESITSDNRETLRVYSGDPVEISVAKDGDAVAFPEELLDFLENDTAPFSRVELDVALFGQKLPDNSALTSELKNVRYEVCTTETSAETVICAPDAAQITDLVFDLNQDGVPGFLDQTLLLEGALSETDTRGERDFQAFSPSVFTKWQDATLADDDGDGTSFVRLGGYLDSMVDPSESFQLNITFDVSARIELPVGSDNIYHPADDGAFTTHIPKVTFTLE